MKNHATRTKQEGNGPRITRMGADKRQKKRKEIPRRASKGFFFIAYSVAEPPGKYSGPFGAFLCFTRRVTASVAEAVEFLLRTGLIEKTKMGLRIGAPRVRILDVPRPSGGAEGR